MTLRFPDTLHAWDTPEFEAVFKRELVQQAAQLPLQQCVSRGSHATDAPPVVVAVQVQATPQKLRIRTRVMFSSVIAGCSCADDPTPQSEFTECAELLVEIDRGTAQASIVPQGD